MTYRYHHHHHHTSTGRRLLYAGTSPWCAWLSSSSSSALSLLLLSTFSSLTASELILPQIPLQHYDVGTATATTLDRTLQTDTSNGNVVYEPIRIQFDTRVLDSLYGVGDTAVDAKIDFIKATVLPAAAQKWAQHLYVLPTQFSVPIGPASCFFLYSTILTTNVTYTDTDLVIIVGGDPGGICSGGTLEHTLAYAFPCGLDEITERPVVGTFNFCLEQVTTSVVVGGETTILDMIGGTDVTRHYSTYTNATFQADRLGISLIDITVHEMAHILGFISLLYAFTRDEDGLPRTARTSDGLPVPTTRVCGNGTTSSSGFLPSENVVQVIPSPTNSTGFEQYIVTERTRTITQMQFNCSTLIGARLEDADLCFGSHWHERLYFGELLSPVVSEGTENLLSLLTLALMEDTGWYRVDCTWSKLYCFSSPLDCCF
jgi:hypothetical protein